eukprot:TRINITY_DN1719_c0_g1_i1.p1 TRINITY_DN1719_c0_g1~~TRINITY_DN1719_c0_g1_i1.p1  ORF type:complete len:669 (-),score=311.66 TRINITY_DN1719_c0_g1_i1:214-2220(-)
MGKERMARRRPAARLPTPTGVPTDAAQTAAVATTRHAYFDQLDSADRDEREFACSVLANAALEAGAAASNIALIEQHGALRKLVLNVAHRDVGVRRAAAGALRNITLQAPPELCERLVSLDALTPLLAALSPAADAIESAASAAASALTAAAAAEALEQRQTWLQLACQLLAVLWHLAEASERAVQLYTDAGGQPLLATLRCLDAAVALMASASDTGNVAAAPTALAADALELAQVAAHFLNVVTDANAPLASRLCLPPGRPVLERVAHLSSLPHVPLLLRTLLAGVLANVMTADSSSDDAGSSVLQQMAPGILGVLSASLQLPVAASLAAALAADQPAPPAALSAAAATATPPSSAAAASASAGSLAEWRMAAKAQTVALEVLTNLAAALLPDDDDADSDDDEQTGPAARLAPQLLAPLLCSPPLLIQLCATCAAPSVEAASAGDSAALELLQERAWVALGNVLLLPSVTGGSGSIDDGTLHTVWSGMLSCLGRLPPTLLEAALAALRAVIDACHAPLQPSAHEAALLYSLVTGTAGGPVRANAVSLLAALACQQGSAATTDVVRVLLERLADPAALVVAAALDGLFDVFAGDSNSSQQQQLARTLDMLSPLRTCLAHMHAYLQAHKKAPRGSGGSSRAQRDERNRVDEAAGNLVRFIDYVEQLRRS